MFICMLLILVSLNNGLISKIIFYPSKQTMMARASFS